MLRRVLIPAVVVSLLLSAVIAFAADNGNSDPSGLYYVKSEDPVLKATMGARHEFPGAFSAHLSEAQLQALQALGIQTEPVSTFRTTEHKDSHISGKPGGGTNDARMCFPTFQVPSAIKRIYNSNSITSTSGGAGVDVAVLDTGVYKEHLDLKGNVAQCKNFVGKMKEGCSDGNGHGTHVSGTIAANAGTDKKGIYGVAPEAKLLAYKVCNDAGVCSGDSIAKAIRYAADNGAEVISMSLGGDKLSTVEKEAIDYATSNGVLVVAAAGNSGPDLDTILYPAAYDKVVAVAATNTGSSPSVYDFSSRGVNDGDYVMEEREVEVGAPGSTQSTYKDGCYYYLAGTSMATPHVSGLAAKFWNSGKADIDLDGVTTAEEVRQYVQTRANATDIVNGLHAAAGDDPASGFGFPTVPPS